MEKFPHKFVEVYSSLILISLTVNKYYLYSCGLFPYPHAWKLLEFPLYSLCTQFPSILHGIFQSSNSGIFILGNVLVLPLSMYFFPPVFTFWNFCQSNVGPCGLILNYFLCYFHFLVLCYFLGQYLHYFSACLANFLFWLN